MHSRNHRLFHHLASAFVLTSCTIERIDLGGIDTIAGEVTAAGSTTSAQNGTTEGTCLAYKDGVETKLVLCSETVTWTDQGYCVEGPLEIASPPTICPPIPGSTSGTTDVVPTTTALPETCTAVVENGTTLGVHCDVPPPPEIGPDTGCGIPDENWNIIPLPCDNGMDFSCIYVDAQNNPTRVTCDTAPSPGVCGGDVVDGTTVPFPCDTTTAPSTTSPDDLIAPLPPRETNESDRADAGAASIDVDAATR
jgi:hypothetical protein